MSGEGEVLTPTEDLVLEVLGARLRLGETLWTFETRIQKTLDSLCKRGLITQMHGMVEKTVRASLTPEGVKRAVSDTYTAPLLAEHEEAVFHAFNSGVIHGARIQAEETDGEARRC